MNGEKKLHRTYVQRSQSKWFVLTHARVYCSLNPTQAHTNLHIIYNYDDDDSDYDGVFYAIFSASFSFYSFYFGLLCIDGMYSMLMQMPSHDSYLNIKQQQKQ